LRTSERRHKPAETAGVLDAVYGASEASDFRRVGKGVKRDPFFGATAE
jgi:hypothetical protein